MQVTLKGLVISKYGNAGKFGEALGWSGRKARDIVSGRQMPDAREIEQMAEALNIVIPSDLKAIFFADKSTKC